MCCYGKEAFWGLDCIENKVSMTWCLDLCHCCFTWSTYGLVVKKSSSSSPIPLKALKVENESSSANMFGKERRPRLWSSMKSPQRRTLPLIKVQRSTSQREGKFNFSKLWTLKAFFCLVNRLIKRLWILEQWSNKIIRKSSYSCCRKSNKQVI